MATKRELIAECRGITDAVRLIGVGLRGPLVAEMTGLSDWYVRKLVLEVTGLAPQRGQVPNSDTWYVRGQHQMHAALFWAAYAPLRRASSPDLGPIEVLVRALARYRLWVEKAGWPELMTADRAWWFIKMLKAGHLAVERCRDCGGFYIINRRCESRLHHGPSCWGKKARERRLR